MEETAYTTTLFRFYLFQIIRRSHTEFIFKTLTEIDRTVNGSPDKPGGLSIQLCKSEKKEFYIRYSS